MTTYQCQVPGGTGEVVLEDEPLGRGGEGSVYAVKGHTLGEKIPPASTLVAKIYHDPSQGNRGKKLVAMIVGAPDTSSVAWPVALVVDSSQTILGYLMEKLPSTTHRMWAELAHTQQRRNSAAGFDVRYALTASLNFALALSAIHEKGHRVGDINESNIFIGNDARVLLVDTDSAQIAAKGKVFPCLVGKPEYTAAELSHGPLKDQERTEASDVFGYAVAVYQLLLGGPHPTDGIFEGDEEPPSTVEKIRAGILPNLKKDKRLKAVPRVASEGIPSSLRALFLEAFSPDPSSRPSLPTIQDTLEEVLDNLTQCGKVKQHWYDKRDKKCGWCLHAKKGQPDPWDLKPPKAKASQQRTLKPIKFKEERGGAPQRAPRRSVTAGASAAPSPQRAPMAGGRGASPAPRPVATGGKKPLSSVYAPPVASLPVVKGKTLLSYVDGTTAPRPTYDELLSAGKFKLAYRCFVNEMPKSLRLTWPLKDKVPTPVGLLVGFLLCLAVAYGWWKGIPLLDTFIPPVPHLQSILSWCALLCAATTVGGSLLRVIFTLRRLAEVKKTVGTFEDIQSLGTPLTAVQMVGTGVAFGPIFLVGCLITLLSLLITFIKAVGRA